MSSRGRSPARLGLGGATRPAGIVLALVPLLATLAAGVATAGPPPPAITVSAQDLARTGGQIRLLRHSIGTSAVVEIVLPARWTSRQLAIAPDGRTAALADRYGPVASLLTLANADGSQTRVNLPGLIGAGYAPDGSWLAAIDGRGALWRVIVQSGAATLLADGPFTGSPIVRTDGSILLLAVASVAAPISSTLVAFDPDSGAHQALTDEQLVYGAFPLADGSLAVAAHEVGGTVVRRLAGTRSDLVADLGPGAVNVAVASDGQQIAFVRGDEVFYVEEPHTAPRRLARGSDPTFAPDGKALLVQDGGASVVIGLDGSPLATFDAQVGFVACGPGCRP
ncbi:MAG TPA: hypothetical protein VK600_04665 [Candidatus Saccharimonadales bacterium]|nr:hypothetical protein [Candidatus Saccharimonadales bacterium]